MVIFDCSRLQRRSTLLTLLVLGVTSATAASERDRHAAVAPPASLIYVDGQHGSDSAGGTSTSPLKTISAALMLLPEPLTRSVTIHWIGGTYDNTGGHDMPFNRLDLMRRMRPGVAVQIVGHPNESAQRPVIAWEGNSSLIDVREGDWRLENVQIGSGSKRQRRGVAIAGPAHMTLKDITIRTRSFSDGGIFAHRGGMVSLRGAIRLNEHLHDRAGPESFAGIIAEDHGLVRFVEREGAFLDIGNGSLSASYYGVIRLGCEHARITSWGEQSNNLSINNGGRIDLHGTSTLLSAKRSQNTPIGLEHDGHILAEGAHIIIDGTNDNAIVLQKASTLTCNDIELRGTFKTSLSAMSGSMFVGRFIGDVSRISANTGASINIDQLQDNGQVRGPVVATRGAVISLPDRTIWSK